MKRFWIWLVCRIRGHHWLHATHEVCQKEKVMGGVLAPRICLRCLTVEGGYPIPPIRCLECGGR